MFPFFPEQPCRRPDSLSLACENQAPPSEPPPGESLRGRKGEAAGFPSERRPGPQLAVWETVVLDSWPIWIPNTGPRQP